MNDLPNIKGKELKIRVLKWEEIPRAAEMYVEIFKNDVFYNSIFREDSEFSHMLYLYFEMMTKIGARHHQAFIAGDFLGGSIFFPPNVSHISILEQIGFAKHAVGAYSLRKIISSMIELNDIERETPHNLHYYLFLIGHLPQASFDHHGIGRALVMPTLNECDRIQVPCYAEFTSEKSAEWGEKLGFKVFKEAKLRFHPDVKVRLGIRDPLPE